MIELIKMKKLLTTKEIDNFKIDGAVILRKKFNISWIEKLKRGIAKDIKSRHTIDIVRVLFCVFD